MIGTLKEGRKRQVTYKKRCASEFVADGKKDVGISNDVSLSEDYIRTRARLAGANVVEYGIMVAVMAVVIIALFVTVGGKTSGAFEKINNMMNY